MKLTIDLKNHKNHDSTSLQKVIVYNINCEFYNDFGLYLQNNRLYEESTIEGLMKNIKTNIHTVTILYDNVEFINCIFNKDSFYDRCVFKNCKFINCVFNGSMRWCEFDLSYFQNCKLLFNYIRNTTIRKNCSCDNLEIKIKHIDEMCFILGKRYSKYYHPDYYAINLNF